MHDPRSIVAVTLTEAGTARFSAWLAEAANDQAPSPHCHIDLARVCADRLAGNEGMIWELRPMWAASGRPETYTVWAEEVEIEYDDEG